MLLQPVSPEGLWETLWCIIPTLAWAQGERTDPLRVKHLSTPSHIIQNHPQTLALTQPSICTLIVVVRQFCSSLDFHFDHVAPLFLCTATPPTGACCFTSESVTNVLRWGSRGMKSAVQNPEHVHNSALFVERFLYLVMVVIQSQSLEISSVPLLKLSVTRRPGVFLCEAWRASPWQKKGSSWIFPRAKNCWIYKGFSSDGRGSLSVQQPCL